MSQGGPNQSIKVGQIELTETSPELHLISVPSSTPAGVYAVRRSTRRGALISVPSRLLLGSVRSVARCRSQCLLCQLLQVDFRGPNAIVAMHDLLLVRWPTRRPQQCRKTMHGHRIDSAPDSLTTTLLRRTDT